jgi:transcriptional regulator
MTLRRQMLELLAAEPMTLSALGRALGLTRADVEREVPHLLASARAAGHRVTIVPAKCRACGFVFGVDTLRRPGKCPSCRESRIFEPLLRVHRGDTPEAPRSGR